MLSKTWDMNKKGHAVNDWWGLSSGAIDIKLADDLPEGIKTLANFLREGLRNGTGSSLADDEGLSGISI
jgi:hypothetical protein